jgi:hypothetical protein
LSIGTPFDLQPPVERARSAAGEAGSLQPSAWIEPPLFSTAVDLQPLAWIGSTRSAASEVDDLQLTGMDRPVT